ncbi:hypothetical protein A0J61_07194 [Choanephora cucurbitarum]|uniref:Uncharacterized protein n=1 Tax=Choanephora cucurbitarum TaxID=101091 RepID=A0A1C7N6H2_9FUNG|nr:hypothetical protein A0J61_07194 [Choanephora cucurbitarum]
MRTDSLHSIQLPNPYRIKQLFASKDALPAPIHQSDLSRIYSYLLYANHAPDFVQSRAALYFENDTQAITSAIQIGLIYTEYTLERPLSQLHGSLSSRVTLKEGRDKQAIIGGVVLST